MAAYSEQSVEPVKLLTMACNLLHKRFIDATRNEAKRGYAEIEAGKALPMAKVTMPDQTELAVKAALLADEYQGKLNFSHFRRQLEAVLQVLGQHISEQREIPLFNDESGHNLLFHVPVFFDDGGRFNALVLGINLATPGEAVIQLMYLDAAQYRKDAESS